MVSFSCFGSLAAFFAGAAYNEHPAAGEGCLLQRPADFLTSRHADPAPPRAQLNRAHDQLSSSVVSF